MSYARPLRVTMITILAALLAPLAATQAHGAVAGTSATRAPVVPVVPGVRQARLTPAQARLLSADVTDKVIVVFRDQVTGPPDAVADTAMRTTADAASLQRDAMAELAQTHARDVRHITLINAVAATVSPGEARNLAADPAVAEVVPDERVRLAAAPLASGSTAAGSTTAGSTGAGSAGAGSTVTSSTAAGSTATGDLRPLPGACAAHGQVQLAPEALEAIHAATASGHGDSAQALGYTGAGVKVAILADGIDPDNPDFIRADGSHVITDDQDFIGGGTSAPTYGGEAFQDAASSFGPRPLSVPCRVRILGVAPGASLVALEVASQTSAVLSEVLEAVDYAVTVDHVNIINESLGVNPFPDTASLNVMKMANDAAVRAGVTVTVAPGNAGPTDGIGSPASDPKVISVGASTTYRSYAQAGVMPPGAKGWLDDNIAAFSSGGFEQENRTNDVVAPGDTNWAPCTPDPAKYSACTNLAGTKPSPVEDADGTSESAPLTAGVAALVIQAYRESHRGQTPSPAVVKQIIVSTAQDIDAPADQQGAGLVDAYQAVLAAASYPGGTRTPDGHAVLSSATEFSATGPAGATEHFTEKLTNAGSGNVTVGLSSRTLGPYRDTATRTLRLTEAREPLQMWVATANLTSTVRFFVQPGQARLSASVATPGLASIFLIAPDGDLAAFNNSVDPSANYGNVQVSEPAAGEWTAVLGTSSTATSVPALFGASTATWEPFGTLSARSVTLPPGGSRAVTLTVQTPESPGDQAGSIVLQSSARTPAFARVTSVPVTLRSLLPAPDPSESFTVPLTGGHPSGPNIGQVLYYQMDLPAGLRALNASVGTSSAANTFFAELIGPSDQAASTAGNGLTAGGGTQITPETGAQLHVLRPAAGRWWLAINFYGTVSGTALSQPITITINDIAVPATVSGLPDSPGRELAPGKPVTVQLRVTDTGAAPEAYFVDPRLAAQMTAQLTAQTVATVTIPVTSGKLPIYLVPAHTTAITATASSPQPLYFDLSWPFGDPDLISGLGTTATRTYTAPQVADGDWSIAPFLPGPFGATAASPVQAIVSMTARTAAFDTSVTSRAGDMWLASLNASAHFKPYVVDPGQSVTIPVTITPHGTPGSIVRGTLYLDDSSLIPGLATELLLSGNYPTASDVAAFSYSYTIR
jgi:subtilisin family serine protease